MQQVQLVAPPRDANRNPIGQEMPVPAAQCTFRPDGTADAALFSAARPGNTGEWQVTGLTTGTGTLDAELKTSAGKGFTVFPDPGLKFFFLADTEKPRVDVYDTLVTVAAQSSDTVTVSGSVVIGDPPIPASLVTLQVSRTDSNTGPKVMVTAGGQTTDLVTLDPANPTVALQIPASSMSGSEGVFSGYLVVRAKWDNPRGSSDPVDKTVRVPIFARQNKALEPYRVVLMSPRRPGEDRYLFVKPTLNDSGRPIAARGTLVAYIRDRTFTRRYYQAGFDFDAKGMVSYAGHGNALFAVPITDTLLVRWTPGDTAYSRRADYFHFTAADRAPQLQATAPAVYSSPVTRRANAAAGRDSLRAP